MSDIDWKSAAEKLAADVTHSGSRWRGPVASTPRHLLVPRWWANESGGWRLTEGTADETAWMSAAYSDRTLVTRIGPLHADHAEPGTHAAGSPTSSSTMPGLTVTMFRHALIGDGQDVAEIGTGSGYGAALLSRRLGERHVTSVDVDAYLTKAAQERLERMGLAPALLTLDATEELPGAHDRIIATVSVRPVPPGWMTALRPGGRLVTTIAGTGLLVTADKADDGCAYGRVERDRAAFMATRSGPDYPPAAWATTLLAHARTAEGEEVSTGRYPVVQVQESWELWSTLSVLHPGIDHRYEQDETDGDTIRTAYALHPDGSWARARQHGDDPPEIHQSGPRRLWDLIDGIRELWLREGQLPVYGAQVKILTDGTIRMRRGSWTTTIR